MAQHAFRREDYQRLAPVAQGLAAEQMKILRGIRRLRDLNIVFRGELQEALDAGAGVFRSLAFVAVGKKQDEAGEQAPLGFAGGDELIDDGLRDVDEIAELRFPENERFGIVAAVSVFEAEHARLGKRRVVDFAARLAGCDVFQRHVFVLVFNVDQDRVALVEGTAAGVLPAEANRRARFHQAGEGESFGHAVVDRPFACSHFGALLEQFLHFRMNVEVVGIGRKASA